MIEHDRRQIRAAFRDVERKSALMIGEAPERDAYPLHHAFHQDCPGRKHAVRMGFNEDAFELSVRLNVLSGPPDFTEYPHSYMEAVERVAFALRLAHDCGLKIVCCFGPNAKRALGAALKPPRELAFYRMNAIDREKPPWIYCFDHPSPANPIWKADNAARIRLLFSDLAGATSHRIVSIGWTRARRARRAERVSYGDLRSRWG